jgi:hypothetical protein
MFVFGFRFECIVPTYINDLIINLYISFFWVCQDKIWYMMCFCYILMIAIQVNGGVAAAAFEEESHHIFPPPVILSTTNTNTKPHSPTTKEQLHLRKV